MNRNFEKVVEEIERMRTSDALTQRKRKLRREVRLAIAEARAWTNFEILEALTEAEGRRWAQVGKQNAQKE